jgi:hypothetical protein
MKKKKKREKENLISTYEKTETMERRATTTHFQQTYSSQLTNMKAMKASMEWNLEDYYFVLDLNPKEINITKEKTTTTTPNHYYPLTTVAI